MRFLMHENEPDDRTHDRHIRDMAEAIKKCSKFTEKRKNRVNINGVKGFHVNGIIHIRHNMVICKRLHVRRFVRHYEAFMVDME